MMIPEEPHTLKLSPEEMEVLGQAVFKIVLNHHQELKNKKIYKKASYEELSDLLDDSLPMEPSSALSVLAEVQGKVLTHIMHVDHPRFFSFVPGPTNYVAALADALASGFNVFSGHWLAGSGAAKVEMICINWLKELLGFPKEGGGLFVSGGSAANLNAIAMARYLKFEGHDNRARVYYSHQTHSSLAKGLRILGFHPEQMRPVDTDQALRINVDRLEQMIQEDLAAGAIPFCVVGNAGTTNTGTVDDLCALRRISHHYQLWFHVDGAYGAAAILTEEGKKALEGIGEADSLTIDPHKWWFQPFEIGCLLVRNQKNLLKTFRVSAEYLLDTKLGNQQEINYYDHGMQLTRSFRALKFYMTVKTFGLEALKQAVQQGMDMAVYLEKLIRAEDAWEIVSPAQLGVINFRFCPSSVEASHWDKLNKQISDKIIETGFTLIITTVIYEKTVLRVCPIHPQLEPKDMDQSFVLIKKCAQEVLQELNQTKTY